VSSRLPYVFCLSFNRPPTAQRAVVFFCCFDHLVAWCLDALVGVALCLELEKNKEEEEEEEEVEVEVEE